MSIPCWDAFVPAIQHPDQLEQPLLGHWSVTATLDEIAADHLEQLIADAIAHRTRAERGLEL
ncbi:MAG: hypothetical protein M3092_00470 [Actinomycetia bacterium]|nr:hypothetical protein [Actinomycetes bacterium]